MAWSRSAPPFELQGRARGARVAYGKAFPTLRGHNETHGAGSLHTLKISKSLILLLLLLLPGCKALVSRAVATAPNQGRVIVTNEDDVPRDLPPGCSARHLRCDVGSPPASLSTWVIDPASGGCGAEPAPRATVLLLHGF